MRNRCGWVETDGWEIGVDGWGGGFCGVGVCIAGITGMCGWRGWPVWPVALSLWPAFSWN